MMLLNVLVGTTMSKEDITQLSHYYLSSKFGLSLVP